MPLKAIASPLQLTDRHHPGVVNLEVGLMGLELGPEYGSGLGQVKGWGSEQCLECKGWGSWGEKGQRSGRSLCRTSPLRGIRTQTSTNSTSKPA